MIKSLNDVPTLILEEALIAICIIAQSAFELDTLAFQYQTSPSSQATSVYQPKSITPLSYRIQTHRQIQR